MQKNNDLVDMLEGKFSENLGKNRRKKINADDLEASQNEKTSQNAGELLQL